MLCNECLYWCPTTAALTQGKCHLRPPVLVSVGGEPVAAWPATGLRDFCGEFKAGVAPNYPEWVPPAVAGAGTDTEIA